MKKLSEILHQAPHILLELLQSGAAVSPESLQSNRIDGYDLGISAEEVTRIVSKRYVSHVQNYIRAREEFRESLQNSVGYFPWTILPLGVFAKILKECKFIRFEHLNKNGEQNFDFQTLHAPFVNLFHQALVYPMTSTHSPRMGMYDLSKKEFYFANIPHARFADKEYLKVKVWEDHYHDDDIVVCIPARGIMEPITSSFTYRINLAYGQGHHSIYQNWISKISEEFNKMSLKDHFWNYCFNDGVFPEINGIESFHYHSVNVVKPVIPKSIELLREYFIKIHQDIPSWKLSSAVAAKDFIVMKDTSTGLSLADYVRQLVLPLWETVFTKMAQKAMFMGLKSNVNEYLSVKNENNESLFYYIVKRTYNNIEYEHAVVIGEYNEPFDDVKALEIAAQYSKAYEGGFKN